LRASRRERCGGADAASYRAALHQIAEFKAAAILVAIGTNDAYAGNKSDFPVIYRQLLKDLRRHSATLLMAGLPPMEDGALPNFDLARADTINSDIQKMAGRSFIALRSELNSGHETIDGIHLSAEGYKPWLSAMLAAVHAALRC
jgi:lysophospholipase L1-like esterase